MRSTPGLLITGASGVIGGALYRHVAADAKWAATRVITAQRRIATGLQGTALALDLGDEAQVKRFIDGPLVEEGPWAGGALFAGMSRDAGVLTAKEEDFDCAHRVNAHSSSLILAALIRHPGLILPGSSFLLVSSSAGLRGNAGQAAYSASKGALLDIMARYQAFFAAAGARLNTLLPPLADSPLMSSLSPEKKEQLYATRLLADPDPALSCALSAAFLLSPQSSYVHASVWHADSRISGLPWQA